MSKGLLLLVCPIILVKVSVPPGAEAVFDIDPRRVGSAIPRADLVEFSSPPIDLLSADRFPPEERRPIMLSIIESMR